MRHKVDRRKLGLPSDQRRALLNNLVRQLIRHGYVHTTLGRAKELRRLADRMITLGKADTLASRRMARRVLVGHSGSTIYNKNILAGKTDTEKMTILKERSLINGEDLVQHLFDNVAPRFRDRKGGYTRVVRTGVRRGDAAETAVVELVD
jgi:large subunit ribosomal protein L17